MIHQLVYQRKGDDYLCIREEAIKLLKNGGSLARLILEFDIRVGLSPTIFFIILLCKKFND